MIKCSLSQAYVKAINIYAFNIITPKYIKQKLRLETNSSVINMIINTMFSTMKKSENN